MKKSFLSTNSSLLKGTTVSPKNFFSVIFFMFFSLLFAISQNANAQTTLSAGDIAIVELNSDAPKSFAFVVLKDISASTVVKFTDNGWTSSDTFRANEGVITWTAPASGVSFGTIVRFNNITTSATVTTGTFTASGSLDFSGSGDQLIVYQNTSDMIAALNTDGTAWGTNASSANNSDIPTGLSDGVNCGSMNTSDSDNNKYSITSFSGTKAQILASIYNPANWTKSETVVQTYTGTITCSDCGSSCTTPTLSFATASYNKTIGDGTFTQTATSNSSGAITYSSSNSSIASVDNTTGAITIGSTTGTATITASQVASGSYCARTASYSITVACTAPSISFATASYFKTVGDATFTQTATSNSSGTITYSSSNSSIASVNSSTGAISIGSTAGTATITASQAASGSYCAGTTSYTITVAAAAACTAGLGDNIFSEDFSAALNATKWTSSYHDVDDSGSDLQTLGQSFWGVDGGKFVVNDIEGPDNGCAMGGENENFLTSSAIDISAYTAGSSLNFSYTVTATGDLEESGGCNNTDLVDGEYSINGGSTWITANSLVGDGCGGCSTGNSWTATYSISECINITSAIASIKVRFMMGNQANAEYYYLDDVKLSGIKAISASATSVSVGSTVSLTNATSGGSWSSSNTAIATVNSSGIVTGVAIGSATITYTVGCCSVNKTITVVPAASTCKKIIAAWDFEDSNLTKDKGYATATITNIGGTTADWSKTGIVESTTGTNESTAYPNDEAGKGFQTKNYPLQGDDEKTAGIKIALSTVGYQNVKFEFDIKHSEQSSNTNVIQYTTDGSTWVDCNSYTILPAGSELWYYRTYDFSSIPAADNNVNFAIRVVSKFKSGGNYYGTKDNTTGQYLGGSDGGKYRFDNIVFSADTITPTLTITNPSGVCSPNTINLKAAAVTTGSTSGYTYTYWQNLAATTSLVTPTAVSTSGTYYIKVALKDTISGVCSVTKPVSATINALPSAPSGGTGSSSCGTGTTTISVNAAASGYAIDWYDASSNGTFLYTGASYTTPSISSSTNYYALTRNTTTSCVSSSRTTVTATHAPLVSTWNGTTSTDWNTASNWSNGVPNACTNVTISTNGVVAHYPIIPSTGATCNYIIFEPETGVLGLQYLDYTKAFVNIQFQRNKWYNLTAPLKNMYSGDYSFSGAPVSYMRLFDTFSPDNSSTLYKGTWTGSFANQQVTLNPGEGFAFMLGSKTWDFPNGYSNISTDKTIVFPRMNLDSTLLTGYVPYSALTGKPNPYKTVTVSRDNTAYRFAMEDATGQLQNSSVSLVKGMNLVGNPMLCHLDLESIYSNNSAKIDSKFKLWNGSSFITYDCGLDCWSDDTYTGSLIAPMQSFLVENITSLTSSMDFNLAADFVKKSSEAMNLRSVTNYNKLMYIECANSTSKNSTVIALRDNGTNQLDKADGFKLFSKENNALEVYTMANNQALDINVFSTYPYTTPIGIHSNVADTITLKFNKTNSFEEDVDIHLLNTSTGERINVKETPTYTTVVDSAALAGNLFLEFRSASVSTDDKTANKDDIKIVYANNQVQVTSPLNEVIESVQLIDESGRILTSKYNVNNNHCTLATEYQNPIYIVKVTTNKQVKVSKLLAK